MTQTAKLTASDGAADDDFGYSVSISGNTVVVGADDATVGGNAGQGAAYVFTEPGTGWASRPRRPSSPRRMARRTTILASRSRSAAARWWSERIPTVGRNDGQGAAYVFTEPGSGWASMTETAELTASDGAEDDNFGTSVSISGNTLVVGAYDATVDNNSGQGAAYVFSNPYDRAVTGVSPTQGPAAGGTTVTITGTNLATPTAVNFGSTTAKIVTDTATQIVVTSPAESAGTVDVTVFTADGASAVSPADQFTYLAAPR